MSDVKEALERWESTTVKKATDKFPERKENFLSTSQIEFKRLLTPEDMEGDNYLSDLGFPGEHPFTRGVQPTMYRGRLWTMRQYAGFGTAEDTNRRYKYLLDHGQSGMSVAFDLPTLIGYDSDNPLSEGIPLDKVSTSMTINSTAATLLAMYMAVAEKQGVEVSGLRGTIQNDILKEYIARGTYIYPPKQSMRIVTDIFSFCKDHLPQWNTISISGYHIREAGSSAVQEVAFTLADGIAYVDAAIMAGLDVDAFARRLSFFFNCHNNFLEEIAKFRAARRLWARIMKERFKAQKPASCMLRFHTQTAGCTLTAQQPYNNVVRVAYQALAAVLGGTQSLHTNSFDEALCLPTEEAVRLALRTQQVVGYETQVTDSIDPLGGSYLIESLTNQIEGGAEAYIEKIDALGGMIKAIEEGYVQREIGNSAYLYQKEVENKERIIVGVNQFETNEPLVCDLLRVNAEVEERQKKKIEKVKRDRDSNQVGTTLKNLKKAAEGTDNLIPPVVEAVKAYATLGEIADVLREVFGEYREQ